CYGDLCAPKAFEMVVLRKKRLRISGREFVSVPKQVIGLDQLQVLEMSPQCESCLRYQMDLLPHDISHLPHLTCSYVDSNHLKTIAAETGTLSHLERLTLSSNSLSSLPPEMGALQRLRSLHLANNSLTELPASLSTIPCSIWHLENLETLLLHFNSLESLPEDVCLLRNLHTLWLGNNHVRSLPASFGELLNLDWGCNYCSCNFEGNPLECPLPEATGVSPLEVTEMGLFSVNQLYNQNVFQEKFDGICGAQKLPLCSKVISLALCSSWVFSLWLLPLTLSWLFIIFSSPASHSLVNAFLALPPLFPLSPLANIQKAAALCRSWTERLSQACWELNMFFQGSQTKRGRV
uniref:Leucine-rich repeat protein SHOC-2 n=1 Tax=Amazona collaria TaxID=241587 RepID=A0A8B9EX25_9PSIT